MDGFEVAWVDDMSFVTEMHLQSLPPANNFSLFIFGSDRVRTIYPAGPEGHSFVVTIFPHGDWPLGFIDLHVVQSGSDLWGFGPINPVFGVPHGSDGYSTDIAVVTTKQDPNYRYWRFSPLGFEGTWFSVQPLLLPNNDILGFFAGFFPVFTNPAILQFGVVRARFNISSDVVTNPYVHWNFNWTTDIAVIVNNSQFLSYNEFYKPFIFHVWNVTGAPSPNTTYTAVIDPGTLFVRVVIGDINPEVPLTLTNFNWNPQHQGLWRSGISSASVYYRYNLLVLGISGPGLSTGAIAFVHIFNLTTRGILTLPTNYSDPKALAIDQFNGTLYVGMNGGGAVLRIDIHTMNITGYQNTPPYLSRAWAAHETFEHVYFVSNEQHTKVFRLRKDNFCPQLCHDGFGYCERGRCVCAPGFDMVGDQCQWHTIVQDNDVIKKDKAGEAVLGVFFALSFVAAAIGWFLVWKAKRAGYQAV